MIILLCGLSGVGKTTLSTETKKLLEQSGILCEILDGDEMRTHLFKDLDYTEASRKENMRRLAFLGRKFSKNGVLTLISAINPYESIRQEIKKKYKNVKIVYLTCSLNHLIERDTKGLYRKAALPENHPEKLTNLTGINDTFDVPTSPDLCIDTEIEDIGTSAQRLLTFITESLIQIPRK